MIKPVPRLTHLGACAAAIPGPLGHRLGLVAYWLALPEVLAVEVAGAAGGAAGQRVACVGAGHGHAAARAIPGYLRKSTEDNSARLLALHRVIRASSDKVELT
jgi:hypothetical protein